MHSAQLGGVYRFAIANYHFLFAAELFALKIYSYGHYLGLRDSRYQRHAGLALAYPAVFRACALGEDNKVSARLQLFYRGVDDRGIARAAYYGECAPRLYQQGEEDILLKKLFFSHVRYWHTRHQRDEYRVAVAAMV